MSPARSRRWPWLLALGLLAAVLAVPLALVPALLPSGVIYAPNSRHGGRSPSPTAEGPRGEGTALRLAVGPPAAELSVTIVSPPTSETGPGKGEPPTVLVLHGIRDSQRSMRGWGQRLAAAGFRVVLVDLRGHGGSTGRYLTYGVQDRRDLSQVMDHLLGRGLVSRPFGVLGFSYGGATAIELAGVDPRFEVVVAVAPFADLRSAVRSHLQRYLPLLWRLVPASRVQRAVDEAGRVAGFDPDQASPRRLVSRARARILILHGTDDRKLPPWHSELIRAAAPDRVQLDLMPGRDHVGVMSDPEAARRAAAWLDRGLRR